MAIMPYMVPKIPHRKRQPFMNIPIGQDKPRNITARTVARLQPPAREK